METMTQLLPSRRRLTTVLTVVLMLAALTTLAGSAAAHNPACHQTAGADGPHYDDDPKTGSETAFQNNPTLGGEYPANSIDACSVGNSQSPRSDN